MRASVPVAIRAIRLVFVVLVVCFFFTSAFVLLLRSFSVCWKTSLSGDRIASGNTL